MRKVCLLSSLLLLAGAAVLLAEDNKAPLTPEEILKRVTWPKEEYDATVFASPPEVAYPIFLSSAPDGSLFIGCDPNGSLDRKPGVGHVTMARDTDGDGKADKFTQFCQVDSPRGVAWDASTRTLYVMHPPNLTAYHDDQNTGVANRQEDILTGLGFGLDFRGADHTTNGCRIGIDGWIYIATGDYGAVKATGKDGRSIAMRGGGVVRIRPDGSGLEQVVFGTRNVLSVALSPEMEIFARDNTNDGDDWNDRLSHFPFGAQMGYPILFRNFSDEIIPAMVDFGGGSPVGSLFLDEPSQPKGWARGFYSVEWGRGEVDLHPLTANGATYKAETKQFLKMTRPTDLEADGTGHLYAASWDGATFTYAGPNVGYVVRLTPKGLKAPAVIDLKKATPVDLVGLIGSESAVWREGAQRELLTRGAATPITTDALRKIVETSGNSGARVAAMYTLRLLLSDKATPVLVEFTKKDELRESALKALADDQRLSAQIPAAPFLEALSDKNPKVRLQAVTGLGHLARAETADRLLPLTADADYTVAHMAVRALMWMKASEVCLRALDSSDAKVQPGALRVLQSIYEPAVVDGLLKRMSQSSGALREGIFKALCRLDFKEAPYTDPKMWWGTRPDTSGPIYKPEPWDESEKIQAALKKQFEAAEGDEAKAMVVALLHHKVAFPGLTDLMLSKAGKDTASRLDVIQTLVSSKAPTSPDVLTALSGIAGSTTEQPELRARAFRMLASTSEKDAAAVMPAFVPLATVEQQGVLKNVWEEYTRDPRHGKHVGDFAKLAKDKDPAARTLGTTVLVNLATSTVIKDKKVQDGARKEIASLWNNPEHAATLLSVIGKTRASQFGPQVRERLNDKSHVVAEAAEFALTKLGLDKTGSPAAKIIAEMKYEDIVKIATATKGDATKGQQFFLQQGCVVCHTLTEQEPPKGPMLGGIATRYTRAELCESILKPSAKIAQGFESQWFRLKNKEEVEGFVTKEGGDSVEVRNIIGATTIIEKANIDKREKREKSIMPEGLVANIPPEDLASLLAFLETTKSTIPTKK